MVGCDTQELRSRQERLQRSISAARYGVLRCLIQANANIVCCTGKRIVELQTSLAILTAEASSSLPTAKKDSYGRTPYQHPALEGVEQLTEKSMSTVLDINRMASLADGYGLNRVLRWKPKNVRVNALPSMKRFYIANPTLIFHRSGTQSQRIGPANGSMSNVVCNCRSCGTAKRSRGREPRGTRTSIRAIRTPAMSPDPVH
jgi:hypothetical protein